MFRNWTHQIFGSLAATLVFIDMSAHAQPFCDWHLHRPGKTPILQWDRHVTISGTGTAEVCAAVPAGKKLIKTACAVFSPEVGYISCKYQVECSFETNAGASIKAGFAEIKNDGRQVCAKVFSSAPRLRWKFVGRLE